MITRPCDVETSADFGRYYHGGWIAYHGDNDVYPFQVGRVQRDLVSGYIMDKKSGTCELHEHQADWNELRIQCDFGKPDVGMVNNGDTVIYGAYRGVREASRGFRPDRVSFYDFNYWPLRKQLRDLPAPRSSGRRDIVWQAFFPQYAKLNEALRRLEDGSSAGEPISRCYGVYTLPDSVYPLLAYKRWTIGYFYSPSHVYVSPLYKDYAADIQKQLGIEVSVDERL